MVALRSFLIARPGFIRLLNAAFAVLVGFHVISVTPEQFALVIGFVEAAFSYVSNLAFRQDVEALSVTTRPVIPGPPPHPVDGV